MIRSRVVLTTAIVIVILFIAMGAFYSLPVRPTIAITSDLQSKDITPESFTEFICSFGDAAAVYWCIGSTIFANCSSR